MSLNAALALVPGLRVEERRPGGGGGAARSPGALGAAFHARRQHRTALRGARRSAWQPRPVRRRDGALPPRARSGLHDSGLSASLALAPTARGALWLARADLGMSVTQRPRCRTSPRACRSAACSGRRDTVATLAGLGIRERRRPAAVAANRISSRASGRSCSTNSTKGSAAARGHAAATSCRSVSTSNTIARRRRGNHGRPATAARAAARESGGFPARPRIGHQRSCAWISCIAGKRRRGSASASCAPPAMRRISAGTPRASGSRGTGCRRPVVALRLRSGVLLPLDAARCGTLRARPERESGGDRAPARPAARAARARGGIRRAAGTRAPSRARVADRGAGRRGLIAGAVAYRAPGAPAVDARRAAAVRDWEGALVTGPERIETGWWDGHDVRRDYYVALYARGRPPLDLPRAAARTRLVPAWRLRLRTPCDADVLRPAPHGIRRGLASRGLRCRDSRSFARRNPRRSLAGSRRARPRDARLRGRHARGGGSSRANA